MDSGWIYRSRYFQCSLYHPMDAHRKEQAPYCAAVVLVLFLLGKRDQHDLPHPRGQSAAHPDELLPSRALLEKSSVSWPR